MGSITPGLEPARVTQGLTALSLKGCNTPGETGVSDQQATGGMEHLPVVRVLSEHSRCFQKAPTASLELKVRSRLSVPIGKGEMGRQSQGLLTTEDTYP